jgi:cytochrome c oxidase subunit 2
VVLGLVTSACSSKAPSITQPRGPGAEQIADVWWLMFGLATAVYVVVAGLIIAAALRGRGTEGEGRPSRISDNGFIWVGGILVPAVILGVLAVVTVQSVASLREPDRKGALRIEVTGYRWWWKVSYPTEGITTANEIRIPAGRPIEIGLRTNDVIHSFWVPELAGKVDQIPDHRNTVHIKADRPGEYRGQCAEFCGLQHAKMAFLVRALTPADFNRWVARQQRPAAPPSSESAARGELVFTRSTCGACHAIRGTDARGTYGPDLTDFGDRRTIGAVSVPNTRANLAKWVVDSQSIKPGNLMPPITMAPDDVTALLDYLESQR